MTDSSVAVHATLRRRGITQITVVLAQALWLTWYSPTVFAVIGGLRAQMTLIALWVASLLALSTSGPRIALARLRDRGAEISCLALFVVVNIVYLMLHRGTDAHGYFVKSVLALIIGVTASVHLTGDLRRYFQVGIVITLVLGLIATVVLPVIYLNPSIARNYEYATGEQVWFGSWGFFMSYAIAVPSLVTIARFQRIALRWLLYACCGVMSVMILYSTFATSIVLLTAGLGAVLVLSVRRLSSLLAVVVIAIAGVVGITTLDVSAIPQLEYVSTKIEGIFTTQSNRALDDPNNPQVRAHLTSISVHTFAHHPLFGVGGQSNTMGDVLIGNHSGIIDGLAEFGIIGLAPYLLFLGIAVRGRWRAWCANPGNRLVHGQLVTFALYVVGSIVNPVFLDAAVMVLVFVLALSPVPAPDRTELSGESPGR